MYPWIKKMFPEAYFIHWIRNPLDSMQGMHMTDDFKKFNVPSFSTDTPYTTPKEAFLNKRYQSWLYHETLIECTPKPQRFLQVWFEDFVLRQEQTLQKLEKFLGIPLVRIPVDKKAVGRYVFVK
jgi:hypothetical protein